MSTLAAVIALPVAALAVFFLLRSPIARRLRQTPESTRWHTAPTPLIGGVGIYVGFTVGIWLAVLLGPLTASTQLVGIYAGASLLFLAGLVDDLWSLPPAVKLLAQLGAAVIVMSTGTSVQIVDAPIVAIPLGLLWLVGMTNAFNLLDNMDGLAGSLAVISAAFFASAAALHHSSDLVLCVSLSLALAVAAFLPFNLRPGRSALAWMGDSGSQLIGFTLASLGLASSYTVASSTVATLVLPVLVLAVPILDTTLVTIVRLLDGRPVSQGGRDHSSHRLVSLGVSETGAVVLLALLSAALGATSLAYQAFGSGRVAAIGVLVSFALLIQFGSFLADVDREQEPRSLFAYSRRFAEVIVDGALISASFLAAYLLRFNGIGTFNQRHFFLLTLPVLLFCRFAALLLFGMYAGVWRYASSRDVLRAFVAVGISGIVALGIVVAHAGRDRRLLAQRLRHRLPDLLACDPRSALRRAGDLRGLEIARHNTNRRVLIVGAGRTGRSLLRELRETPGERVVGFVDDDPALRGRRLSGIRVTGNTELPRPAARAPAAGHRLRDDPGCAAGAAGEDRRRLRRARSDVPVRQARRRCRSPDRPGSRPTVSLDPERGSRSRLDRALAAYPLVVAYVVLLILYAWQTTKHSTPWLFTDELEWSGLSRGIAHHGVPQLRLHNAHSASLYSYVIAPSWWLGATGRAYAAIKYENAAVMTASLFPAYGLARLFVPRRAAIACGIAAAAIPAVAYTGLVIPESLAYFWSTLTLWLTARALRSPSLVAVAAAVAALALAPFIRSELAVLGAGALVAAAVAAATSPRGRELIGSWTWRERIGASVLAVGVAVALGGVLTHKSYTWQVGTHFHDRAFTYGLWAVGAFAIGVGVLPVFISLLWLLGARFRLADERALAATLIGAVVGFGLYTAVKASYLSTTFATRVEERNLIYIAPVVFTVTARWLLYGRARVGRDDHRRRRRRVPPRDDAVPQLRALLLRRPRALDPAMAQPHVGLHHDRRTAGCCSASSRGPSPSSRSARSPVGAAAFSEPAASPSHCWPWRSSAGT